MWAGFWNWYWISCCLCTPCHESTVRLRNKISPASDCSRTSRSNHVRFLMGKVGSQLRKSIAISRLRFIFRKIDSIFGRISEFLTNKKYFWVRWHIISNKNIWKIVFGLRKLINRFSLIKKLFLNCSSFGVLCTEFSWLKPQFLVFQYCGETLLKFLQNFIKNEEYLKKTKKIRRNTPEYQIFSRRLRRRHWTQGIPLNWLSVLKFWRINSVFVSFSSSEMHQTVLCEFLLR